MNGKIWTIEEIEYLKKTYANTPGRIIVEKTNRTIMGIYGQAAKMGLKKSQEYLKAQNKALGKKLANSNGSIAVRFQKGHIPANKNKKMDPELYKKAEKTMFKKGHLPANTLFDGAITIRKDKSGIYYKWIRISKAIWKMLQIYNWEQENGPIPKDRILICKDNDHLNCDPVNWQLADRKKHLERNSGRDELSDKYISMLLSIKNKDLREYFNKSKELIELKRSQIKLRRVINEHN